MKIASATWLCALPLLISCDGPAPELAAPPDAAPAADERAEAQPADQAGNHEPATEAPAATAQPPGNPAPAPTSLPDPLPADQVPAALRLKTAKRGGADRYGDPLPKGAVQRLGSRRFRVIDPGMNVQLRFRGQQLLVAARVNFKVSLRDVVSGKTVEELGDGGTAASFSASPDGRLLASGCSSVMVYDRKKKTRQKLHVPRQKPSGGGLGGLGGIGSSYTNTCVAFDAAGKLALTAMGSSGTHVWDPSTAKKLATIKAACDQRSVDVTRDGSHGACTTRQGAAIFTLQGDVTAKVAAPRASALAFSADGKTLVVAGQGQLASYDLTGTASGPPLALPGQAQAVALSDDGAWVAAAVSGRIFVFDGASGRPVPTPAGHDDAISGIAFAGSKTVFTGSWDGSVMAWNATSGEMLEQAWDTPHRVNDLSGHGDKVVAVVGYTKDSLYAHDVRVFDASAKVVHEASGRGQGANVALTSEFVVVGGERSITLHPLGQTPVPRVEVGYKNGGADRLRVSADGSHAAFAAQMSDTIPRLSPLAGGRGTDLKKPRQNAPGGKAHKTMEHDAGMSAVAFSRDGKLVATGERAGGVHLWSVPDGKFLGCHKVDVSALVFSANGKRLFAGTEGGYVLSFPAKPKASTSGGRCERPALKERRAHDGPVEAIAVSEDGRLVATGARDGMALIWAAAKI